VPAKKKTVKEVVAEVLDTNGGGSEEDALTARFGDEEPFTLEVGLRGVTPLLFNRMDIEAYDAENPVGGKKRPRKRPDPKDMVWWYDDERLALPTINVVRSIVAAGRYYRSPISSNPRHSAGSTLTEALAPATEYTPFSVKEWDSVDFRLARHGDIKRTPKLLEILTRAGQLCGIGDGRKIGMGRFVIAWHEITEGVPWA
jgi:hypothetical protein